MSGMRPPVHPGTPWPAPLSTAQHRLWVLHSLRPTSEYNLQIALRLRGPLEITALRTALRAVQARHAPLRVVVGTDATGAAVQVPWDGAPLELRVVSPPPAPDAEQTACAFATVELETVFDLAAAPPVRAAIAEQAPDDHVLAVTLHHLAFDGWSTGRFLAELSAEYRIALGESVSRPPEPTIDYGDYAHWERELLEAREPELLDHWRSEFTGVEELFLPGEKGGRGVGGRSGTVHAPFNRATVTRMQRFAREFRVSSFAVLVAAYQLLLHRYSRQTDFVVGTPVASRVEPELEELVGCFVNTVCLRARMRPEEGFGSLARRTQDTLASAVEHQELPFDRLVSDLAPRRDVERNPLFRAFCSYVDQSMSETDFARGVRVEPVQPRYSLARFELNFIFAMSADPPQIQIDHSLGTMDPTMAEQIGRHFHTLLDWALVRPDLPVRELPLMLPAERRKVLALLNDED